MTTVAKINPFGFDDTQLDVNLNQKIGEMNASCSYCPGIHKRAFCSTCKDEILRCELVNVAQKELMKGVRKAV